MKKKSLLMTIAILIIAMSTVSQVTGTFTDSRDGKTYKTVKIGTQTWMVQNLAYKVNNGCWAYMDNQKNVTTYGYLYDWETAKTVCFTGWHLPSDAEWKTLINYLGGPDVTGDKLKRTGKTGSDFTALPGGNRFNNGVFDDIGNSGYWWSSSEVYSGSGAAWYLRLVFSSSSLSMPYSPKNYGFSLRCVKD